jgi:uncharacterized circularly permuted ATP-grasp superfamily protein
LSGSNGPGRPWSEAYTETGAIRAPYAPLLEALGGADLAALKADAAQRMAGAQALFGGAPFSVCPMPRLIEASEWRLLEPGLAQRARALSAFVCDAYGARAIVADGVMPASVIDEAEGYEPALAGRWPTGVQPLGVVGMDVVRDRSGELLVLEDNVRTPSGYSYAVATRNAVLAALEEWAPRVHGAGGAAPVAIEQATVDGLRAVLTDAAVAAGQPDGRIVVLTDGPGAAAFYEHRVAAAWLGAPLVTLDQLERRGDELWLPAADERVACVYRRTEVERLYDESGRPTTVGELLLEPWLAGHLAVVNALGAGVADDKLAHAYVERMIGFYLGEEPLLRSVPTLDLTGAAARAEVLADLRAHVIKPRHGHGGHGVVICAHAEAADIKRVAAKLRRPGSGKRYIAQRTVQLSTAPTIVAGALAERHVDLRPYVFATRAAATVAPGGLTRVAWDDGALVVNSSQNGGAKDTWVLR